MGAIADSTDAAWTVWKVVYAPFDWMDTPFARVAMEYCWRPAITYRTEEDAWAAIELLPPGVNAFEKFEARWVVKTNIMAAGG